MRREKETEQQRDIKPPGSIACAIQKILLSAGRAAVDN
jgi:hypothetical protein